jgi:hypothetical protein
VGGNVTQGGRAAQLRKPDLWYYDRLPPTARAALANAAFSWASGYYYNRWSKGVSDCKTGADIARRIASADASIIRRKR